MKRGKQIADYHHRHNNQHHHPDGLVVIFAVDYVLKQCHFLECHFDQREKSPAAVAKTMEIPRFARNDS